MTTVGPAEVTLLKVDNTLIAQQDIDLTTGTLEFSSAKSGTVQLSSGTATVNTNVVLKASDRIFLSRRTTGGSAFGTPVVAINSTGAAGTASFTVVSKSPADGTTTVVTDNGLIDWVVFDSPSFA